MGMAAFGLFYVIMLNVVREGGRKGMEEFIKKDLPVFELQAYANGYADAAAGKPADWDHATQLSKKANVNAPK